jgi:hypothetical protein
MLKWLHRDNTAVMHRAAGGSFEGNYVRDLRRTTVHDASSTAWGLNEKADTRPGFNSNGKTWGGFDTPEKPASETRV